MYGLGGEEPTVTDAAVVLGYLDPSYFLGGRIKLDRGRAEQAITERAAAPLGIDMERAAYAILTVANEHMVTAIRDITINQGLDPREALIVAGGGAAGLAIALIAEALGCDRVLVPRTAGALSACGGQFSDIVTEFSISRRADTNRFDFASVNEGLDSLAEQMDAFLAGVGGNGGQPHKEFFVEARYPYQVWELEVPLRTNRFETEEDVATMVDDFHRVHERVFAVKEPGQHVECIYWKGRAVAGLPKPRLKALATASGSPAEPTTRPVSFGEGRVATSCYHADSLAAGQRFCGPAIVEEATTTVVVPPGWALGVIDSGDYMLTRERSGA